MTQQSAKTTRQEAIEQIITTQNIYTQAELTLALQAAGFKTAQATISRDLHEMHIIKERTAQGRKYAMPTDPDSVAHPISRIFRHATTSIQHAGNMLVINTMSGMAMAVASTLDDMNYSQILGCVAGDDTIICVIKTEEDAEWLVQQLSAK